MKNLLKYYDKALNGSGDSDKHLLTLFSLGIASGSKVIIELGVRHGDTTEPLLDVAKINDGTLYSVDINDTSFVPKSENEKHWSFNKMSAIEFLEEFDKDINVDLVYVDDWHSYEHVKRELELLDEIVSPSTVIVLHDLMYGGTEPFYHSDLTPNAGKQWENGGVYRAVAELNPQFWEFSTLPWNNGLTILRKKYSSKFKNK